MKNSMFPSSKTHQNRSHSKSSNGNQHSMKNSRF